MNPGSDLINLPVIGIKGLNKLYYLRAIGLKQEQGYEKRVRAAGGK